MNDDREREQIQVEAAHWVQVLASATPAQRLEFMNWVRQSRWHVQETLLAVACDDTLQRNVLEALSLDQPADGVAIEAVVAELSLAPRPRRVARVWRVVIPLAATLLLTVLGVFIHAQLDRTIETDVGQWRTQTLGDGSLLTVAPLTRLTVALGDGQRLIELVRGEALFEVEKDAARPFVVVADSTRVRAIGTRFGVARRGAGLTVTVEEGGVVVESDAPRVMRRTVVAGHQVTVSAAGIDLRPIDTQRALAWVRREVIYQSASAMQAVAEFNSRNRLQIELDDPALAAQPVTGVFRADDPETLALAIAADSQYKVSKRGDVLHIERASQLPREQVGGHDR